MSDILMKKFKSIFNKTKPGKSENEYVHLFEVLEEFNLNLKKYSSSTNRDFPELENKNILARDAYHFTNNDELISISLIIESDNNKVSDGSLYFMFDYYYYDLITGGGHSHFQRVVSMALDPIFSGPGF